MRRRGERRRQMTVDHAGERARGVSGTSGWLRLEASLGRRGEERPGSSSGVGGAGSSGGVGE